MTAPEIMGMIVACVSGVALPMIAARNKRIKDLEDRSASTDVKIARLEAHGETVAELREDMRGMREDVAKMTAAISRLEGAMTDRNHN